MAAGKCDMCDVRENNEGNLKKIIQQVKKQRKPLDPDINKKTFAKHHLHKSDTTPVSITLAETQKMFEKDNPDWTSTRISVPIKNLATVKFPRHKVLEDARVLLKDNYKRLRESKKPLLDELKEDIDKTFAENFTREELPVKLAEKIRHKLVREGAKDNARALHTLFEQVKRIVKEKLTNYVDITKAKEEIYKEVEEIVKQGVEFEIIGSADYGRMIHRKGEEAELLVKEKIEEAVGHNACLIINGFKVWEYTNKALGNIGIKLKTAFKKNEVEHDIMLMTTHKHQPQVHVEFIQIKDPDIRPWNEDEEYEDSKETREKFKDLANKALDQTCKDTTAFFEMFPDLTEEEIDNIRFDCFAALPNSAGESLCQKCSAKILTKDVFGNADKLRTCLQIDSEEIPDGAQDLYSKIASRYVGVGSLVPLKTLGDYYKEEMKQLDDVETAVRRGIEEAREDQTEVELALRLSDDQLRAACSRQNLLLTGPHGTGKTILLLLGVSKRIKELTARGRKVKVCLVIWERSKELKKRFQSFAKKFEDDTHTEVKVYFKGDVLKKYGVGDYDDRVKTINEVMAKLELEETEDTDTILGIDELSQIFRTDFIFQLKSIFTGASSSDFSGLTPGSTHLLVSIQPVQAEGYDDFFRIAQPVVTTVTGPATMEVVNLRQVFRSTTSIHRLLQTLHKPRVPSVGEAWLQVIRAGFIAAQLNPTCVMDPEDEGHGHSIEGTLPEWYPVPRCPHFLCSDAVGCFLEPNKEKLARVVRDLQDNFGEDKVAIIVDVGGKDEVAVDWIKQNMDTQRVHRVVEFIGGETEALVFLQRGDDSRNPAKYNGWSRATSKLTIFTDDHMTNTWFDLKEANNSGHLHIPDQQEAANPSFSRRTLCRMFGREDWFRFIRTMLLFLPSLLLHLVPLVVASVLHWKGATQHITRIRDFTMVAAGMWIGGGVVATGMWKGGGVVGSVVGGSGVFNILVGDTVWWGLGSCAVTLAILSDRSTRAWIVFIVFIVFIVLLIPTAIELVATITSAVLILLQLLLLTSYYYYYYFM